MRPRSKVLAAGIVVLVGVVGSGMAGAQYVAFDDFEDGIANGWQVVAGDWGVVDGEYVQSDIDSNDGQTAYGYDQISVVTGGPSDHYFVQADIRSDGTHGLLPHPELGEGDWLTWEHCWFGVVFRYQDSLNYEEVTYWWSPRDDWVGGSFFGLDYWVCEDGVWTNPMFVYLNSYPYEGEQRTLKVVVDGDQVTCYDNDQLVMQATDPSSLDGGAVGLYSQETVTSFDNWHYGLSPEGASIAIGELISDVTSLNLQQGIDNSLDAKLDAALQALDDVNEDNNVAAVNALEAFIAAVQAQAGKQIPLADAAGLIADAQGIIAMLQ